jgi:hypothetical protein
MRQLPRQKMRQKGECLFIPAVEMKAMRLLENLTITHRARAQSGVGIARERFDVEFRNGGGALAVSELAGGLRRTLAPRRWGRRHLKIISDCRSGERVGPRVIGGGKRYSPVKFAWDCSRWAAQAMPKTQAATRLWKYSEARDRLPCEPRRLQSPDLLGIEADENSRHTLVALEQRSLAGAARKLIQIAGRKVIHPAV